MNEAEPRGRSPSLPGRILRHLFFGLYLIAASVILLFAALEFTRVNELIGLDLPYYVMRRTYTPDSVLVFTSRHKGQPHRMNFSYRGDIYSDDIRVDVPYIDIDVTYDPSGFRSNRSAPPYDVAVIGDSYIEQSETDDNTFTAYLAEHSARSVLNLGTSWYGPYQYVEVLKRLTAQPQPPRHALFMFYAGNDVEDIRQYERWLEDGRYYGQDRSYWKAPLHRRFAIAARQALDRTRSTLRRRLRPPPAPAESKPEPAVHPRLALVQLDDGLVPMLVAGRTPEMPADTLLASQEWQTLRRLIGDFAQHALEHGITPIVVYLPTKMQTYASHIDPASGRGILEGLDAQRHFAGTEAAALAAISADAGLCFVDILPLFQSLAAEGELLYHQFDTHWNERGREAAAREVAAVVRRPGSTAPPEVSHPTVPATQSRSTCD
jgi:hypothetical protein